MLKQSLGPPVGPRQQPAVNCQLLSVDPHPPTVDVQLTTGRRALAVASGHSMIKWPSQFFHKIFTKIFTKLFDLLHLPSCCTLRSTAGTSSRLNTDSLLSDSFLK